MEYGVCAEPVKCSILADAGYDFIELNVQRDLQTTQEEEAFGPSLELIRTCSIPAPVANSFLPGGLKITGPAVDMKAVEQYVTMTLERAERAGLDTIVFGSGGARRIPEGFDRDRAWGQLLDFGRMLAPIAQQHNVVIVVEPLNRRESNVFNSIGESAAYVRQVDHPYLRLLVDAYHWGLENDSYADLVEAMPLIRHAHIATYNTRQPPGGEPCDFGPFFRALKEGGYDGRLAVEARWPGLEDEAAAVRAELVRLAEAAGR